MQKKSRFAVTTDLSEFSTRAFGPGAGLARTFDADLHVVHQAVLTLLSRPQKSEEYFAELEKHLEQLAKAPEFAGLAVTPHLVRGGQPGDSSRSAR